MDEDLLIPGLPNDLVRSTVFPGICWWDFASATRVNRFWRAALNASLPLLFKSPPLHLPSESSDHQLGLGHRTGYGSLVLGRKIIIAGGQSEEVLAMDQVDMFDLDKQHWESLPSLSIPLSTCFMGVLTSPPNKNRIAALGGVMNDEENSFWIESAQLLGYGDHEWTQVETGDIPKLLKSFSYLRDSEMNLAMLTFESGGLAKTLVS